MFPDLVSWRTTAHPRGGTSSPPSDDLGLEVHHTVTAPARNAEELRRVIRGIYDDHVGDRGWADVFYGFFVALDGSTAEGRGFDRGTSSKHYWLTVALVQNTDHVAPTPQQLEAVRAIRAEHRRRGGGDQLRGHGDRDNTACPGAGGRRLLEQLRSGADEQELAKVLEALSTGYEVDARWPWMGRGARGKHVTLLQHALNVSASQGLAVDGIFGAATDRAVRNVQAFFGITGPEPAGVVGPATAGVVLTDWTLRR